MEAGKLKNSTKSKIAFLAMVLCLSGCNSISIARLSTVEEIRDIPEDCKNKTLYINYLERQLDLNKPPLKSKEDYDQNISAIKDKIWRIRYACQFK
jgi:hypothetical protein